MTYVLWVVLCFIGVQFFVALLFSASRYVGVNYSAVDVNTLSLALRLITLVMMALALVWLPKFLPGRRVSDLTVLGLQRSISWRDIGLAIVGLMVAFVGSMLALLITQVLFKWIDLNEAQDLGLSQQLEHNSLILAFIVLVVVGPFVEELMFRGYLFGWLRRSNIGFVPTTLIVSSLFALVHFQWNVALDVFVLSLVMCYMREKTGSLWTSVIIHALKNGVAFYFLFINPVLTGIL